MIRSQITELAQISVPTFNSHLRAGNLPFALPRADGQEPEGRTWVRYDAQQAALLVAARDLADRGMGWSAACEMLRSPYAHVGAALWGFSALARCGSGEDVHRVRVELLKRDCGSPMLEDRLIYRQGDLFEVIEQVKRHVDAYNDRMHFGREFISVAGMISTNLSAAWRTVIQRAAELKIDLHAEDDAEATE